MSALLPPIDRTNMEILARPLPRLVEDSEPVVALDALAADRPEDAALVSLPALPKLRIAGDHPWSEIQALAARRIVPAPSEPRPVETVQVSGNARTGRVLSVTSEPAGAKIFVDTEPDGVCQSPCDIQLAAGTYVVRLVLAGFQERQSEVELKSAKVDLAVELKPARGNIAIEAAAGSTIKVNETPVASGAPFEMALNPGLYRITSTQADKTREQWVNVKPGARLRLRF